MKKSTLSIATLSATLILGACVFSTDKAADNVAATSSAGASSAELLSSGAKLSSGVKLSSGMILFSSGVLMSSGSQNGDPFMQNTFPKLTKECQDLYTAAQNDTSAAGEAKMQNFVKTCGDQVATLEMPQTLDANCQSLYKDAFTKMKASMALTCDPQNPSQQCIDAENAMKGATDAYHKQCETQAPGYKFPWENGNQGPQPSQECKDAQATLMGTYNLFQSCTSTQGKDCSMVKTALDNAVANEIQVCGEFSVSKQK